MMKKFFTGGNIFKILILIILIIVTLYGYIKTRRYGCTDKKALNYDPKNNIDLEKSYYFKDGDKGKSCIYPAKGCMDKKALNYDLYANVSCSEDCDKLKIKESELEEEIKIANDKRKTEIETELSDIKRRCKYAVSCTKKNVRSLQEKYCPRCLCIYSIKGCTRPWCINYESEATDDGTDSSNVLEANSNTDYSTYKGCIAPWDLLRQIQILVSGACDICTNQTIVKIDNNYILDGTDKSPLFGIKIKRDPALLRNNIIAKSFNTPNGLYNFLITEAKTNTILIVLFMINNNLNIEDSNSLSNLLLESFNAKKPILGNNTNYILITSGAKDIYYEEIAENSELLYPNIQSINIGCFSSKSKNMTKINESKYKFFNNKSPFQLVNRCSNIALQEKKKSFAIIDTDCYILNKFEEETPQSQLCGYDIGCISVGQSKNNSYHVYNIDNVHYEVSELIQQSNYVSFFSAENFDSYKYNLGIGVYTLKDYNFQTIKSMIVPKGLLINIQDANDPNIVVSILGNSIKQGEPGSSNIPEMKEYLSNIHTTKIESIIAADKAETKALNEANSVIDDKISKLNHQIKSDQQIINLIYSAPKKNLNKDDTAIIQKNKTNINNNNKTIKNLEDNKAKNKDNLNKITTREQLELKPYQELKINNQMIISDVHNSIILFQQINYIGFALPFPIGKFIIPSTYAIIYNSINIPEDMPKINVTLYTDSSFKNKIGTFKYSDDEKNKNINNNNNIKSIIVQYEGS